MQANSIKLSCTSCGHLPVCKIFPNVASMAKQLFPEGTEPTFHPEDFANICKCQISKTVLANTQEDNSGTSGA